MALPKLDIPRYELIVPSTGEVINYRPYLVKEEKILMIAMESKDDKQTVKAIKDIITACTNGEVNVNKITMFDMEYIFVKLRSKSVGEKSTVSLKCGACDFANEIDINLDDIDISEREELAKDHIIKLSNVVSVSLRYPLLNDVMASQLDNKRSETDRMFDLIVSCIDSIYSKDEVFPASEQSKKDLLEFIESLNSVQFGMIKDFLEHMPTAYLKTNFNCIKCEHENEIEIKGISGFFN
jgi:hypothetical protein